MKLISSVNTAMSVIVLVSVKDIHAGLRLSAFVSRPGKLHDYRSLNGEKCLIKSTNFNKFKQKPLVYCYILN